MIGLDFEASDAAKGLKFSQTNWGNDCSQNCQKVNAIAKKIKKYIYSWFEKITSSEPKGISDGATEISRFIFINEGLSCVVGKSFLTIEQ